MYIVRYIVLFCFFLTSWGPIPQAQAQPVFLPKLAIEIPQATAMVKGLTVYPDNPTQFDLIVEPTVTSDRLSLQDESMKMIKYFLASLTTSEGDMWVNLSPYEKGRVIPDTFGQTLMGRDLLAQDYILKQITASLIHPDSTTGKEFWAKVYKQAQEKFGITNIPINTFNKVWIMPDKATVWEHGNSVFVIERHLKVMLEQDYLSMNKAAPTRGHVTGTDSNSALRPILGQELVSVPKQKATQGTTGSTNELGSQIVRDIVIPVLEREVNEGDSFAQLRQIYNSMILATWFKKRLKDSLLGTVYVDKNKTQGVNYDMPTRGHLPEGQVSPSTLPTSQAMNVKASQGNPITPNDIYQEYLKAFKKGVFNFIKEEPDPTSGEMIPRKYFSGGMVGLDQAQLSILIAPRTRLPNSAQLALPTDKAMKVMFKTSTPNPAMQADADSIDEDYAMSSKRTIQADGLVDEGMEGQELTWQDLEKEGYSVDASYIEATDKKRKALHVVLKKHDEEVEYSRIVFYIYPQQKIVYINEFSPKFPKARLGRGRALLRHILLSQGFQGFHIASYASTIEFRNSLRKMIDFQIEEDSRPLGLESRQGLTSTPEIQNLLKTANVYGIVPSNSAMTVDPLSVEKVKEIVNILFTPEEIKRLWNLFSVAGLASGDNDYLIPFDKITDMELIAPIWLPHFQQVINQSEFKDVDQFMAAVRKGSLDTDIILQLKAPMVRKNTASFDFSSEEPGYDEPIVKRQLKVQLTAFLDQDNPDKKMEIALGGTRFREVKRVLQTLDSLLKEIAKEQGINSVDLLLQGKEIKLRALGIQTAHLVDLIKKLENEQVVYREWVQAEYMDLLDSWQWERLSRQPADVFFVVSSLYLGRWNFPKDVGKVVAKEKMIRDLELQFIQNAGTFVKNGGSLITERVWPDTMKTASHEEKEPTPQIPEFKPIINLKLASSLTQDIRTGVYVKQSPAIEAGPVMQAAEGKGLSWQQWQEIKETEIPSKEDVQVKSLQFLSLSKWSEMSTKDLQLLKAFVLKAKQEFPQFLTDEIIQGALNDPNGVIELVRRSHSYTLEVLRHPDQFTHHFRLHEGMYYWLFAMKLLGRKSDKPVVIMNVDPYPDQAHGDIDQWVEKDGDYELVIKGVLDSNWTSAALRDGLADFVISAFGVPRDGQLKWMFSGWQRTSDGTITQRDQITERHNDFGVLKTTILEDFPDSEVFLTVDLDQFALLPIEGIHYAPRFFTSQDISSEMARLLAGLQGLKIARNLITADSRQYLVAQADEEWITQARQAVRDMVEGRFSGAADQSNPAMQADLAMMTPLKKILAKGVPHRRAPDIRQEGDYFLMHTPWRQQKPNPNKPFTSVTQAFDEQVFNFNKIKADEIFWEGQMEGQSVSLIEQRWPFANKQFLIVPERSQNHPQIMNQKHLELGIRMVRQKPFEGFTLTFAGLMAGATVNHLHLQAFQALGEPALMITEKQILYQIEGVRISRVVDYPAKALYFEGQDPLELAQTINRYIKHLQENEIAHAVIFSLQGVYILPIKSNYQLPFGTVFGPYEMMGHRYHTDKGIELSVAQIKADMESATLEEDKFQLTYKDVFGANVAGPAGSIIGPPTTVKDELTKADLEYLISVGLLLPDINLFFRYPPLTNGKSLGFTSENENVVKAKVDQKEFFITDLMAMIQKKAQEKKIVIYQIGVGLEDTTLEVEQIFISVNEAFQRSGLPEEELKNWKVVYVGLDYWFGAAASAKSHLDTIAGSAVVSWETYSEAANTIFKNTLDPRYGRADYIFHRNTTYANEIASTNAFPDSSDILNVFLSLRNVISRLSQSETRYVIEKANQNPQGRVLHIPGADILTANTYPQSGVYFAEQSVDNLGTGFYVIKDPEGMVNAGLRGFMELYINPSNPAMKADDPAMPSSDPKRFWTYRTLELDILTKKEMKETGWWIAFDVDHAEKIQGYQGMVLKDFNDRLTGAFDNGAKFFSTFRTDKKVHKEEGYVYISSLLSQEELAEILAGIRQGFKGQTNTTVSFSVMEAKEIRDFRQMINVMNTLLDQAKGKQEQEGDPNYGNKTVFYDPSTYTKVLKKEGRDPQVTITEENIDTELDVFFSRLNDYEVVVETYLFYVDKNESNFFEGFDQLLDAFKKNLPVKPKRMANRIIFEKFESFKRSIREAKVLEALDERFHRAIEGKQEINGRENLKRFKEQYEQLREILDIALGDSAMQTASKALLKLGMSVERQEEWESEFGIGPKELLPKVKDWERLIGYSPKTVKASWLKEFKESGMNQKDLADAILRFPPLVGRDPTERKKTWLDVLGVSQERLLIAIKKQPSVIGLDPLRVRTEWEEHLKMKKEEIADAIVDFPSLAGLDVQNNLLPKRNILLGMQVPPASLAKELTKLAPMNLDLLKLILQVAQDNDVQLLEASRLANTLKTLNRKVKAITGKTATYWIKQDAGNGKELERVIKAIFGKGGAVFILENLQIKQVSATTEDEEDVDEAMTAERRREWLAIGLTEEDIDQAYEVNPRLWELDVESNLGPKVEILERIYGDKISNIVSKLNEIFSQNAQVLQVIMDIAEEKDIPITTVDRLRNTYRGINKKIQELKKESVSDWIAKQKSYRTEEFLAIVEEVLEETKKGNPPKRPGSSGDKAMQAEKDLGGIDMNSRWLNLNIKRDPGGMPLPASLQNWSQIHIEGLEPVIIKMEPVNLAELIGVGGG